MNPERKRTMKLGAAVVGFAILAGGGTKELFHQSEQRTQLTSVKNTEAQIQARVTNSMSPDATVPNDKIGEVRKELETLATLKQQEETIHYNVTLSQASGGATIVGMLGLLYSGLRLLPRRLQKEVSEVMRGY